MYSWIQNTGIALIATLVGAAMLLFPPKFTSRLGYRNAIASRSEEAFRYANRRLAVLWCLIGLGLLAVITICHFFLKGINWLSSVYLVGSAIGILYPVWAIDKELRQKFDEDGKRIG